MVDTLIISFTEKSYNVRVTISLPSMVPWVLVIDPIEEEAADVQVTMSCIKKMEGSVLL